MTVCAKVAGMRRKETVDSAKTKPRMRVAWHFMVDSSCVISPWQEQLNIPRACAIPADCEENKDVRLSNLGLVAPALPFICNILQRAQSLPLAAMQILIPKARIHKRAAARWDDFGCRIPPRLAFGEGCGFDFSPGKNSAVIHSQSCT